MIDRKGYYELMGESKAHLTLTLDTDEPIELANFVGAFTSLANEFERFIDAKYPQDAKADTRIFIKDVRHGSVVADIISYIPVVAPIAITQMDQILVLEDFVRRWGARIVSLRDNTATPEEFEPRELKDFYKTTKSISCDPRASHRLEAAVFEDGVRKVRVAFQFSALEARAAEQTIEETQRLLSAPANERKTRVLMRFTRTDVHDATVNKKSGERVIIKDISSSEKPVIFASEMVEQEIREYIRDSDENVYKRGFVVDVFIQYSGERIIAYSVAALHSVIDIDD